MSVYRLAAFADEADPSIDGQIKALLRNGVDFLEIRGVDGQNIADISNEKAREVKAKLDASGLSVWSLGSPFGKIGIHDDFAPHLEKFRRALENCAIFGCSRMRVFSFYVDRKLIEAPPVSSGEAGSAVFAEKKAIFEEVKERLSVFLEEAGRAGITLCHENEKGIYGERAADCIDIQRALPGLRAVFDPANFIQAGEDTVKAVGMLEPFIEYLHIKDALCGSGEIVPAGHGDAHIAEILRHYRKGVLTIEPHLRVFKGLELIEHGTERRSEIGNAFSTADEAFDAACAALKKIV